MSEASPDQRSHDGGELTREAAGTAAPAGSADPTGSPAANESATPAREWQDLCSLEEIPDGGILTRLQGGQDLLLYRIGMQVTCMPNECPHRGWPFDGGPVRGGVLMCPFHGYEFRLDTGECLTSPSLSLDMYPIRICDGRVDVRLK
jgi:nitrite reductase/ring-hydroxylating ferredoxin subunit